MPAQTKPSQTVNSRAGENTFPIWDLGSVPTTSDIAQGRWAVVDDGTNTKLYANFGGSIESVDLA